MVLLLPGRQSVLVRWPASLFPPNEGELPGKRTDRSGSAIFLTHKATTREPSRVSDLETKCLEAIVEVGRQRHRQVVSV